LSDEAVETALMVDRMIVWLSTRRRMHGWAASE
jgi:hypothetical protein